MYLTTLRVFLALEIFFSCCFIGDTTQYFNNTKAPLIYFSETMLSAKQEASNFCARECNSNIGIPEKTGKTCKCVYIDKTCCKNALECTEMCVGDERLEGVEKDSCAFLDDICYSYKFIKMVL